MSASFVILFWLFFVGIYGLFWLLFLLLFLSGRRNKSRARSCMGGVPFALSSGFALWCLGLVAHGLWSSSRPANVYKITFGVAPSADVTDIRSKYYYFADTGTTFLKFKASPSTIDKLTAKGWTRLKYQEQLEAHASDDANTPADDDTPNWFKPDLTESTVTYVSEHRIGDFASESETLTYNPATRLAYYDFVGID